MSSNLGIVETTVALYSAFDFSKDKLVFDKFNLKIKAGEKVDVLDMFLGNIAGTIGETSVIALLIGAIFLLAKGIIDVRIPVAYGISFLTITPELPHGIKECIPISLLCTWVLGAVLTSAFYKKGKWRKKAIVD